MRGRTNIPNRKDPIINGDVENFVVAENNTITRGDFVSIVRSTQYRKLNDVKNLNIVYKKTYDVVNKKALVVSLANSVFYATIFQCTSNGVVVLNQVALNINGTTNIKFDFNIDTNSLYYMYQVGSAHQEYNNVHKYSIVNDELVEQSTISLPLPTDGMYGFAVFGVEENIAFVHGSSGGQSFRIYSKNSNNEYVQTLNDVSSVTNFSSNYGGIRFVGSGDGCVIVVGYSTQSGSNGYHIVKFYNFSSANGTIDRLEIFASGSDFQSGFDAQVGDGVFYFTNNVKYSASSGSSYWYRPRIGIIDISSNNLTIKYFQEIATITPSWSGWCIDLVDDNTFVVQSFSRYGTATYGKGETGIVVVKENQQGAYTCIMQSFQEINLPSGGSVAFAINGGIKSVVFSVDQTYYSPATYSNGIVEASFNIVGEDIVFGEPTNYVKAYDGVNAIGFAKIDGNAGDTIQVYVPVSNS